MARMERGCYCGNEVSGKSKKYNKLEPALCLELKKIVQALSEPGKGILAVDESSADLDKKFRNCNLQNSETTRRDYRQMLFSSDQSILSEHISGILMHPETLYQKTTDNVEFLELLRQKCIIPGVKVDKGLVSLFGTEGEKSTQGLDDLEERCIQYKRDGCHFARWRCVFSISDNLPSQLAINSNSYALARYTTICQSARLVTIIEPEILNDGDHTIEKAQEVHEQVLSNIFRILEENHVYLEGIILKPSMVLPGKESEINCSPETIAECTLTALQRTVPPAVPAIMFLSGGQKDFEAFSNLNAINLLDSKKPWTLSFCFGRALQEGVIEAWNGHQNNVARAQKVFLKKIESSSLASQGKLDDDNYQRDETPVNSDLIDLDKFITSIEP